MLLSLYAVSCYRDKDTIFFEFLPTLVFRFYVMDAIFTELISSFY